MDSVERLELDKQMPFSRVVQPETVGLNAEDYQDITTAEKTFTTIDNYRSLLLDVPRDSPSAAAYVDGETRELRFVALSSRESLLVTRNTHKLGEAAMTRTLAARPRPLSDSDRQAASRSGVHVIEYYQQDMQSYLDNALLPDVDRMEHMQEYAKHRNLSRKKGFGMRSDMAWFRSRIIDETLDAISHQQKAAINEGNSWRLEDEQRARRALEYRLFFEGDGQKPVDNWEKFLGFELEYWGHKVALFKSKIWQAKKITKQQ